MSQSNLEELIEKEMKRRLEAEVEIAKETGVSMTEIGECFGENHAVMKKYFDTDQRKQSGYNYYRSLEKGFFFFLFFFFFA
jgi:hypothetical protein